jgi:DNA helicase-2/ATP-dependent DNA helicase PcrA
MHPDDVLAALDPEQRAAVRALRGPVCILAGAGTGKTRTITHRIAYGVLTGTVQPDHVLAVTFTARAAGELRGRLRALGVERVQARTFHAAALRQLTYFWPRVVGGEPPRLAESKFSLVGNAASRAGLGRIGGAELRDLISEIEWAKARLVSAAAYEAAAAATGRLAPFPADQVAAAYTAYEELKSRTGQVDFDDLLMLTAAAIEDHEDVADEVRRRYRHFVVDEYQDVSPLQQRLLDAWLGDRDDLCVVGDDDQTIYSFTGASRAYLLDFKTRFPAATVVRLVRDYRSTPEVVGLANRVLAGSKQLVAQLPPGPAPVYAQHDDEPAEAAWVARQAKALLDSGVPASEIAVLYRINAQSEVYEAALATAGVPYVVRGGERYFDRPEVREAMLALRVASRVDDPAGPGADPGGSGGSDGLGAAVRDALRTTGWSPEEPAAKAGAARDRWEALTALAGLADEAGARPAGAPSLAEFVAELEQRAADQHVPSVAGVTLASLHAAKGLEWEAVFVVGLVDGTLPIQHAVTPDEVDEERRLLYVGITRARRHVHLSWALARAAGGRRTRRVSRFLEGVVPAAARPAPKPSAAKKAALAALEPDEQALFERLREWRRSRATELGQPAYCVFTDATLHEIVKRRPRAVRELSGIPGIGARKVGDFGEDVVAVVAGQPGSAGHAGHAGQPGSAGHAGHAGQPGSAGHAGQPGSAGHAGHAGHAGQPGSAGHAGHPGSAGHAGHAGQPGSAGHAGHPGSAGHAGHAGQPGDSGAEGAALVADS